MKFLENISLAEYTTFKVGGQARYFSAVRSEEELQKALDFAKKKKVSVFLLGEGSNILVSDRGFPGLIIKIEMKGVFFEKDHEDVLVIASAGESWDRLVTKTIEHNLWGLENLSGIPGTVGAAPVQNIGAYGAEVKDVIVSVRAVDVATGAARTFSNSECRFSYRESFFKTTKGKKHIITSVTFKLSQTPKPNLSYKDLMEYFGKMSERREHWWSTENFLLKKLPRFRRFLMCSQHILNPPKFPPTPFLFAPCLFPKSAPPS